MTSPTQRVFVAKRRGRHGGAFGIYNKSRDALLKELNDLRSKCREAQTRRGPVVGLNPNIDKLRHLYADAMQLGIAFQPTKGWLPVREEDGGRHSHVCRNRHDNTCGCRRKRIMQFAWKDNPVWGHAPNGAKRKCNTFCNLLNSIVKFGYLANLTHDLVRLTITFWSSSMKNFQRLCRRILARILAKVREQSSCCSGKSPEPDESSEGLTSNPVYCIYRVTWPHTRYRAGKRTYVPRYIPPHRRKKAYCLQPVTAGSPSQGHVT